MNNTLKVLKK